MLPLRWLPLAAFLLLSSTHSPSTSAASLPTVKIGVVLSQTGELADAGKKALAGAKLRLDDHNSNAFEYGYRIQLVIRDDRSNPATAAAMVRELVTVEKVPAIVGPVSSNLMLAMAEVARELGVVVISPTVTSPLIGRDRDWCVRVLFDDRFQGVALARYLREKLDLTRAAAVYNRRFAYADSVFSAFKTTFEDGGGSIVAAEQYEWVADEDEPYDFVPLLNRVAAANPETVLLPVHSIEVAAIIRASLDAEGELRFCGSDTWQNENVLVSSGSNLENAFYVSGIDFESDSPAMAHFFSLFDYSNDPNAQPMSILGYDALALIIKGMERGTSAEAIRDGLYGIKNFEIASGIITIDPERGSEKTAYISRITRDDDGEFVAEVIDEIDP